MKKIKISTLAQYCLFILMIFSNKVSADCFIIKDLTSNDIQIEGECEKRVAPCSTFKIPLALMGYESKILKNAEQPVWPFKQEYEQAYHVCLDKWKTDQTPTTWMKNSCIWYSHVLTKQLGIEKFKKYVNLFDYGNKDITGDPNKNNGLTHSWLSSSLKISPKEQIQFLKQMLDNKFKMSNHTIETTKEILFVSDLKNNWKLYGKTGSGYQLDAKGEYNKDLQIGWFVGWIVNPTDNKKHVFAYLLEDQSPEKAVAGLRAKEQALLKINAIIEERHSSQN